MQTTVVQPGTPTPVITTSTEDNCHHNHGGHGRHEELRTDADYRSLISQGAVNGDRIVNGTQVTGDRINTGVMVTGDRINAVGAAGALASGNSDRLVQTGLAGVHDRLCDSTGKIVGALSTGFTAEALAACKVADAMNAGFAAANTQAAAIGSAAQVLATTFAGQARDDATRNANASSVQATMFANAAAVQAEKNASAAELQAVKDASADQLSQERHHNAVMLKLCECCHETQQGFQAAQAQAAQNFAALQAQADRNACETQKLIVSDGNTTRALVNQIESNRKDDTIAELRARWGRIPVGVPVTIPPGL